jgi:tetratricopeptide (TPR) repeat protein
MKRLFILIVLILSSSLLADSLTVHTAQKGTKNELTVSKETAKAETVYVAPGKDQVLFDNQFHFYDFILKLVIGVFSLFLTVLIALVTVSGFSMHLDRQKMREEIKQEAICETKVVIGDIEKQAKDKIFALESLIGEAEKTTREHIEAAKRDGHAVMAARQKAEDELKHIQEQRAAVLSAAMPVPEEVGTERQAIRLYNAGIDIYKKGNLDEAIAKWREAIRLKPDYVKALNNLGVALRKQGKPEEAIAAYREAIRLKPDYAEAHYNLGLVFGKQEKFEEAITAYREAIRLKPDDVAAYFNLGVMLGEQGKTEDSITAFREAIRLKPNDADAYNILGVALGEQGKIEDAITAFREAIRLKPDFAEAFNNLCSDLLKQKNLKDALTACREAIRLKPDFAGAHYNSACCFVSMGKNNDALESLSKAVENGFDDWSCMEKDTDLDSLRDSTKFKEFAEIVKNRYDLKNTGKKPAEQKT